VIVHGAGAPPLSFEDGQDTSSPPTSEESFG
jgi:hypothetical protein